MENKFFVGAVISEANKEEFEEAKKKGKVSITEDSGYKVTTYFYNNKIYIGEVEKE